MTTAEHKVATGALIEPLKRDACRFPHAPVHTRRFFDVRSFVESVLGHFHYEDQVPILLYKKDKPWEKEKHVAIKSD